jgi:hypothetical protein
MPRTGWIALVAVALLAGPAQGGQKTPVTVKVVVEAYQSYFLAPQRADLEAKAAARITERLRAYVPYFDFTVAAGKPYVLSIRLAPRVTGERRDAPKEIGLHIELAGPRLNQVREYVVFRVPEDLTPITTVDAMVQEIDGRLPEAEYGGRITEMLVHVPIASGGHVIYQPRSGWILPHKVAEICLDLGSKVAIESTVPGPTGPRRTPPIEALAVGSFNPPGQTDLADQRGNIFSEPLDLPGFQREMAGADEKQIVISSVWIRTRESAAECVR